MAGLKDVVTREYTINLHKRVCTKYYLLNGYYQQNERK